MAQFDLFSSQAKYADVARKFYLSALQDLKPDHEVRLVLHLRLRPVLNDNTYTLRLGISSLAAKSVYGYAALLAYHAYGDKTLLKIAENNWNAGLSLTLTDSDIATGKSGAKNFSIASVCPNGATLVGGTFSLTDDASNSALNAAGTGYAELILSVPINFRHLAFDFPRDFLVLSAALSGATSNQTYLDLAQKSADFVQRHMYWGNGVFVNQINSKDCSPVNRNSQFAYDSGAIIHGLSILSSLTQNTSTMAFVRDLVLNTTSNSTWHQSGQILNLQHVRLSDGGEPKVHLMRGYTELYRANTTATDLKSYLGSYISTQFNSVVDRATSPGSNIYGPQYDGPAGIQFDKDSQAGAIAALLGGLAVGGNSALETPGEGSDPRSRSVSVGAIVGAVVGGVALVGLATASIWIYRRRRRVETHGDGKVTPWEAPANSHDKTHGLHGGHGHLASGNGDSSTSPGVTTATTEELVLALNQRLRDERQWDPSEIPPEYNPQIERSTLESGRRT
ncbi:hypothetical protein PQX77_014481 [Marasmius sp. AFHP31]|nr:hypothetical protein PQX77_014481 [Marasmius sp. AFHP31]